MKSTTTTTINATFSKNTFKFQEKAVGVKFSFPTLHSAEITKKFKKDEPGLIDLISDQPKVFVSLTESVYHLYHDHFAEFLTQYEITPDAKFIIDITNIKHLDPLPEHIKMVFKFLNKHKVDYRPIDLHSNNILNINNLYYHDIEAESFSLNHPSKRLYSFAQEYIIDKDTEATKKVYLSRKNFKGRDLSFFIKERLPYSNDNRIDDENALEEYFRSIGFEIVVPEDFKTFEEQMQFFYNTKTLVSLTSSGLVNSCFMRPGSTMVELSTPLISFNSLGNGVTDHGSSGQEELHHFYHEVSIGMGHNYISIPNTSRSSKSLIDTINKNIYLKNLLAS